MAVPHSTTRAVDSKPYAILMVHAKNELRSASLLRSALTPHEEEQARPAMLPMPAPVSHPFTIRFEHLQAGELREPELQTEEPATTSNPSTNHSPLPHKEEASNMSPNQDPKEAKISSDLMHKPLRRTS